MRLTYRERLDSFNPVSIHASVKDATTTKPVPNDKYWVSIHASVKDATQQVLYSSLVISRFNPRICKRCDAKVSFPFSCFRVSIHASVKDATYLAVKVFPMFGFNPRICKRCDRRPNGLARPSRRFQSTHL